MRILTVVMLLVLTLVLVSGCATHLQEAREQVEMRAEEVRVKYEALSETYMTAKDDVTLFLDAAGGVISSYEEKCNQAELTSSQCDMVAEARSAHSQAAGELQEFDTRIIELDQEIRQVDAEFQDFVEKVQEVERAQRSAMRALRATIASVQSIL